MSENSNIQWCDSTVNFWSGCTKVSAGCANCYAEELSNRFPTFGKWGNGAPRTLHNSAFSLARQLNRKPWICPDCHTPAPRWDGDCKCGQIGATGHTRRRRIFSLSMGDWLDPEVPLDWLARMIVTVDECRDVEWLLVTKRPELFHKRLHDVWAQRDFKDRAKGVALAWSNGSPAGTNDDGTPMFDVPRHVMFLASVENQDAADERYGELLDIPGRRGISVEPLLGPVNLHLQHGCRGCNHPGNIMPAMNANGRCSECDGTGQEPSGIDWVIVGGESGHHARPCNVEWIASIKDQCAEAGVPCFVKQLGKNSGYTIGGEFKRKVLVLDKAHGGDMDEWPEEVSVRQFYK